MKKLFRPTLLLIIIIYGCNKKHVLQENCRTALTLTIEKNIRYRAFIEKHWYGSTILQSNLILLPINREIIDAAIDLKCSNEDIDSIGRRKLIYDNDSIFLKSGKTTFIMIAINKNLDSDESIMIPNFENNISIQTEGGGQLKMLDYTPGLATRLNPGFNAGYINFVGEIPVSSKSYSVNFNNVILSIGKDSISQTCALTFDQTKIRFLDLVKQGMKIDDIRKDYTFSSYDEAGITTKDFLNLITTVLKIVSSLA